jgi:catechol 2,3-dioxygenase-like lactoylglutathione lyase family enzyme
VTALRQKYEQGETIMAKAVQQEEQSFFTGTFSSFSVDDIAAALEFYADTLGVDVSETEEGLSLDLESGPVFIYPKENHEPATFTVLNFTVEDIGQAVEDLKGRGIQFESFEGDMETDEDGIFRGKENGNGPNIAWFKDPAGNFLSVIED